MYEIASKIAYMCLQMLAVAVFVTVISTCIVIWFSV